MHAEAAGRPAEPLGPGSLAWRLGFPRTGLLLGGRALLLQVAHPVVGAGVSEFSRFRADPWGRLERTMDSLLTQLFGSEAAVAEAERLRRRHRPIAGLRPDGVAYRALDPEAYAWVHLANTDTALRFQRLFGARLDAAGEERLYRDWRQAGLVLGIQADLLPTTLAGARSRVDETVERTLADNPAVQDLLAALRLEDVSAPPYRLLPAPVWAALRPAGRLVLHDCTVGTLPAPLRERLGLAWSEPDAARLRVLAAAVRAVSAALPGPVLHYPQAWAAVRAARDGR